MPAAGGRPRPPVDAHHPGAAEAVAPHPGEGVEGVVGGGVVALAPVAEDAGHAAEQGQEAQAAAGPEGVGEGGGARHLGLEDPGEGLGGLGRQQAVLADAGPVDHAVEAAVAGVDVVDHGPDRGRVAHVGHVVADGGGVGGQGVERGSHLPLGQDAADGRLHLGRLAHARLDDRVAQADLVVGVGGGGALGTGRGRRAADELDVAAGGGGDGDGGPGGDPPGPAGEQDDGVGSEVEGRRGGLGGGVAASTTVRVDRVPLV